MRKHQKMRTFKLCKFGNAYISGFAHLKTTSSMILKNYFSPEFPNFFRERKSYTLISPENPNYFYNKHYLLKVVYK
ncbi:MAG: hypothetical protein ACI4JM_07455 [Oscillospiraceae bacterium]